MLRAFAISPEEGGRGGTKFKGRRSLWEFVILLSGNGWASVQLDGRGNFRGLTVYAQEIAPRLLRMFISKGGRVKSGLATGPLGNFCRFVGGAPNSTSGTLFKFLLPLQRAEGRGRRIIHAGGLPGRLPFSRRSKKRWGRTQEDARVTSRRVSVASSSMGRGGFELDGRGLLRTVVMLCVERGRDGGRRIRWTWTLRVFPIFA